MWTVQGRGQPQQAQQRAGRAQTRAMWQSWAILRLRMRCRLYASESTWHLISALWPALKQYLHNQEYNLKWQSANQKLLIINRRNFTYVVCSLLRIT